MTTLIRYTKPARDFLTIRDLMERMFEESFGPTRDYASDEFRLPIDAYATDGEIIVQAGLPGVKPESVEISVEGDTLKISAELPAKLENVDYTFAERAHGRYSRTLMLNVPVESDKAEAQFDNGLLTLRLPKAEAVKPKQIKVKAK
ncbi:MAG: Hsp20/alpha crystallin family protein [Chloroflexi bacterium]|nr:Hsp20/alpha crystallin family protein [Chloroflexota bacterium]